MTTKLPKQYAFLVKEPAPRMLIEALKWYGTKEVEGNMDNPVILAWAAELGVRQYTKDSIAWCGLLIALIAKRANKLLPNAPLWARDWLNWGNPVYTPKLGDVLIFSRKNGGHVGLYVGEDVTHYHVLGGNQGDAVSIVRIDKNAY